MVTPAKDRIAKAVLVVYSAILVIVNRVLNVHRNHKAY